MHVQAHNGHLDTIPNFDPIFVLLPPAIAGTAPLLSWKGAPLHTEYHIL
jgi:hypothetical protein